MRGALWALVFAGVACAGAPPAPASPLATAMAPTPAAVGPTAPPAPTLTPAPVSIGRPPEVASAAPDHSAAPPGSPVVGPEVEHPEACPRHEVTVPATAPEGFVMSRGLKGEHRVVLTRPFCMDENEVSVRDYAACVDAGACKEPWKGDPYSTYPTKLDDPVNLVSWPKAGAYCAWAGKRLPTEAEWEWAATGPEQYRYPWGNGPEPSCETVDYTKFGAPKWEAGGDIGCGGGGPSPVGSHPKGDRVWPGGALHDLSGNVWEWVEDAYAPLGNDAATDPVVRRDVAVHVIRGGGWNRSYAAMVVTYRGAAHYTYQVPALGFRCVRGNPLATPSPRYE
jgi:formylglycine-generating enzyme required for sulfatase activity